MFLFEPCENRLCKMCLFKHEKFSIFSANRNSQEPMQNLIAYEFFVSVAGKRNLIVLCQDVSGFQAVECEGKVDTERVTLGNVKSAKVSIRDNP